MAKCVKLGKKASFFRDPYFDISVAPGEVRELNAMQLMSPKVRRALNGGHLVYAEKEEKLESSKAKAPELSNEDLMESLESLNQEAIEKGKDPIKYVASKFNLDQLKAIAPEYDVEVEENDTKATIVEAILSTIAEK